MTELSDGDRTLAAEGVAVLGSLCDELRADYEAYKLPLDHTVVDIVSDYVRAFEKVLPPDSPMKKSISALKLLNPNDADFNVSKIQSEESKQEEADKLPVRTALQHLSMLRQAVALALNIEISPPPARQLSPRRSGVITERIEESGPHAKGGRQTR